MFNKKKNTALLILKQLFKLANKFHESYIITHEKNNGLHK